MLDLAMIFCGVLTILNINVMFPKIPTLVLLMIAFVIGVLFSFLSNYLKNRKKGKKNEG